MKRFLARGRALGMLLAVLLAAMRVPAQDATVTAAGSTNMLLSGMSSTNRADWQKHLTLGAGDNR